LISHHHIPLPIICHSTIAEKATEDLGKLLDLTTALGNTDYELHGASALLERINSTMSGINDTIMPQLKYAVTLHKTQLTVMHESAIADWDRQGWLLKGPCVLFGYIVRHLHIGMHLCMCVGSYVCNVC
jgi:hypothetical protein